MPLTPTGERGKTLLGQGFGNLIIGGAFAPHLMDDSHDLFAFGIAAGNGVGPLERRMIDKLGAAVCGFHRGCRSAGLCHRLHHLLAPFCKAFNGICLALFGQGPHFRYSDQALLVQGDFFEQCLDIVHQVGIHVPHVMLMCAVVVVVRLMVGSLVIAVSTIIVVVVWVFRQKIGILLAALGRWLARKKRPEDEMLMRYIGQLIVATFLTAGIGLGVSALNVRESPGLVSLLFLLTAAILGGTVLSGRKAHSGLGKDSAETSLRGQESTPITWGQALLVGAAQGLGVFPGISRSGITISVGLYAGLERQAAGEFSFLLSIPAILGAFILSLKDLGQLGKQVSWAALFAGFLAALMFG